MSMKAKLQSMAVLIEFLAGAGLGLYFHWVLEYREASYTIFAIGILLSLATYLLREDLETTRESLKVQYNQAHEIPFAIARIGDAECQAKAQELMGSAKRTINMLQQGFIPMDETEFYLESARLVDQSVRVVKAVDPLSSGWANRGALLNFYQTNIRALERGVQFTRIFVVNRGDLQDVELQKILLGQYRDGVDLRIAYRDELPTASDLSSRDTNSSFDFAIYDDRVVTDVFTLPGKYYGRKTGQSGEVARYLHLYALIEHAAHRTALEDERIIVSSELRAD